MQNLQLLRTELIRGYGVAGDISPWPVEVGDETNLDRIGPNACKNDRDRRCRRFGRQRRNAPAVADDDVYLAADEIGRQCRQLRVAVLGPAVFNFDALAVDEPGLAQAAP